MVKTQTRSGMFNYHGLNKDGQEKVNKIRNAFDGLLIELQHYCPESRELSIVKTKLEEASFYAVRCVSMQEENQSE